MSLLNLKPPLSHSLTCRTYVQRAARLHLTQPYTGLIKAIFLSKANFTLIVTVVRFKSGMSLR